MRDGRMLGWRGQVVATSCASRASPTTAALSPKSKRPRCRAARQAIFLAARHHTISGAACRAGTESVDELCSHLKIGYNRAATIIEEMEGNGIISAANHFGKREVLVTEGDGQ